MPWVKLDDNFPEHEKVIDLSDRAFRLHVTALCYCGRNLTDGFVATRSLKIITAVLGWSSAKRWVIELCDASLWMEVDEGHEIKNFTEFNPTADEVKKKRAELSEKRREAGKAGARARWQTDGNLDGKTDGNLPMAIAMANENGPGPSRPLPFEDPRAVALLVPATPEADEANGQEAEISQTIERSLKGAA